MSVITDRSYWLSRARCFWILGARDSFRACLERARTAAVLPDFTAARLAWTERAHVDVDSLFDDVKEAV